MRKDGAVRMNHERTQVADVGRDGRVLQIVDELECLFLAPRVNREDASALATELALHQIVIRALL